MSFFRKSPSGLEQISQQTISMLGDARHSFDLASTALLSGADPDGIRADIEATERARSYFTGYPPSSPSIGLLKDGTLLYMMERRQIESRSAEMIGIVAAFVHAGLADGEDDVAAVIREFEEETGWAAPHSGWVPLGETTMKSRKVVVAWAVEADLDLETFDPGTFTLYGREYPEIDRVVWTTTRQARVKLNPAQTVFIDRLEDHLMLNGPEEMP